MKTLVWVISLFFPLTACVAGEIEIKVPRDAEVSINGVSVPGGEERLAAFNDQGLNPQTKYDFKITAKWKDKEVVETVSALPGTRVSIDLRDRFVAPAANAAAPKPSPAKKADEIPFLIKRNEALAELYGEYRKESTVIAKKEFHLDDSKKYKCEVWNLQDSNQFDKQLIMDSTDTAGGRFIHIALGDAQADKNQKYLLVQKKHGWRGTASDSTKATTKTPVSASDLHLAMGGQTSVYQRFYPLERKPGSVSNVMYKVELTACVTAHKNNPTEIFIELGRKASVAFRDFADKDIDPQLIKAVTVHNDGGLPTLMPDPYTAAKAILRVKDGNHSLPDSPCYQDLTEDSLSQYKLTDLGFCTLTGK